MSEYMVALDAWVSSPLVFDNFWAMMVITATIVAVTKRTI